MKDNACGGNSLSSLENWKDGEYYHPCDICLCFLVMSVGLSFISFLFSFERPCTLEFPLALVHITLLPVIPVCSLNKIKY